jgi:outer membrane lipoprotein SlyB
MKRMLGAGVVLALTAVMPLQPAAAQDAIGGAIVGGALGGIIGGAVGHGRGAVAGAVIGATTGAVIASEAQRRSGGYYWWRGGCYYRYPNGSWVGAAPGYCAY